MATSRDDFGIAIRSALLQRGARQKFSLFVLILISIVIFALDNTQIKPVKFLRGLINDGVYRISAISSSPIKFSTASKNFFVKHVFVYKENEKLKNEIAQLRKKEFNSYYLETENKQLQEVVQLDKKLSFTTVGAKIMFDKNSPYLNSAIINKGTNSGIKLGMAVLSKGHLVGRIVEVNFFSSRILLLNDLNSRIPVMISPGGYQGILSGTGKDTPIINYLPRNYEFSEEHTIFTSGKDGVFYPGIPVGKIFKKEDNFFVSLFSDPNQIRYVNIIIDQATDMEEM